MRGLFDWTDQRDFLPTFEQGEEQDQMFLRKAKPSCLRQWAEKFGSKLFQDRREKQRHHNLHMAGKVITFATLQRGTADHVSKWPIVG